MADEAPPLKLGERGERRLDRPFGGSVDVDHDAQIDDLEHVEPEIAQIVVDRARQLRRRTWPGSTSASAPRRAPILVTMTRSSG